MAESRTSGNSRRYELDGLKGTACFVVFIYHMLLSLFCYSPDHDGFISDILVKTILNGDFMVYVFACISGYLAYKSEPLSLAQAIKKIVKRYLRFVLLLLLSNLIILALYKFVGFHTVEVGEYIHNNWLGGFYTSNVNISGAIRQAIFIGSAYNGPMWVLFALVFAPCMIYIFSWIRGLSIRSKRFLIGVFALTSLAIASALPISSGVPFAMLVCYAGALIHKYERTVKHVITKYTIPTIGGGICIYIIAIAAGLNRLHNLLIIFPAAISLCSVLYIDKLRIAFSNKNFVKTNDISLSIYILHWPLFCSIGLYLLMIMGLNDNYVIHAIITIAVTTAICVFCSWIFHNTVERFVNFTVKQL